MKNILIIEFLNNPVCVSNSKTLTRVLRDIGFNVSLIAIKNGSSCNEIKKVINNYNIRYDTVISSNTLRLSFGSPFLDRRVKFVTWLQDSDSYICSNDCASVFNTLPNDYIFGFVDQLQNFNHKPSRLLGMHIPVLPSCIPNKERKTNPVYISNKGAPIDLSYLRHHSDFIGVPVKVLSFIEKSAQSLLKRIYGGSLVLTRKDITNHFLSDYNIKEYHSERDSGGKSYFEFILFWHVADVVYRQAIIEIYSQNGVEIDLYGRGWKNCNGYAENTGSVYSKYSRGLNVSLCCGYHNRIFEMLVNGCTPIINSIKSNNLNPEPFCVEKYLFIQKVYLGSLFSFANPNTEQIKELTNYDKYCYSFNNIQSMLRI